MKRLMILIHWLTAILIVCAFISIEFRSSFGKHNLFHDVMKSSHLYIGFIVLFLTIVRLFLRQIYGGMSYSRHKKSKIKKLISQLIHLFLYAWLIFMPILGWCIISAKGTYIIPFGLPSILDIMPHANVVAIKDVHNTLAYFGLWVIAIHAFAALFDYYVLRRDIIEKR
ncbi:cytochrome b [Francisella adeliensis]|nr:cytochrome b/b6 domain-containing protein [Francisella adeliensis]